MACSKSASGDYWKVSREVNLSSFNLGFLAFPAEKYKVFQNGKWDQHKCITDENYI